MGLILDIKTLLTGIENNIFLGDMPDSPDIVCVLYESGGFNPQYILNQQLPQYEQPTFQVKIRDISYSNAINRLETIKNTISGKSNLTINGHLYYSITQLSDILPLGKDTKNRCLFSLNFTTKVKK